MTYNNGPLLVLKGSIGHPCTSMIDGEEIVSFWAGIEQNMIWQFDYIKALTYTHTHSAK
jgi:hypothetical protein